MKTVLLVTSDDDLHARLDRAIGADAVLVRCAPGAITLPADLDSRETLIVFDGRRSERAALLADLAKCRSGVAPGARAIAIAGGPGGLHLDVIRTLHHEALEVIFPDVEPVEHLIQAHLNDPSKTAAAAVALSMLTRLMPVATHEVLRVALCGGFRVSSVKEFATHSGKERTSIGKALRALTDWTPTELLDTAKACYAVILLRETTITPAGAAKAVRLLRTKSLDDLFGRIFGMSARAVQCDDLHLTASAWLERALIARLGLSQHP
jgi:AraC-like DNA-binding protein